MGEERGTRRGGRERKVSRIGTVPERSSPCKKTGTDRGKERREKYIERSSKSTEHHIINQSRGRGRLERDKREMRRYLSKAWGKLQGHTSCTVRNHFQK